MASTAANAAAAAAAAAAASGVQQEAQPGASQPASHAAPSGMVFNGADTGAHPFQFVPPSAPSIPSNAPAAAAGHASMSGDASSAIPAATVPFKRRNPPSEVSFLGRDVDMSDFESHAASLPMGANAYNAAQPAAIAPSTGALFNQQQHHHGSASSGAIFPQPAHGHHHHGAQHAHQQGSPQAALQPFQPPSQQVQQQQLQQQQTSPQRHHHHHHHHHHHRPPTAKKVRFRQDHFS
ncbi:hypothetical protein SYNPS1DRAFT_27123 [Syncephalis pseudoplumigaleata]|uniref:Uncharacterized protein n=1 Tax=Syncephalis pseudoplumigaleata TaxID=1712513 RepID=A0A4P9Z6B7_9FUNG|nr:hypothetical protein SYNPS1DRAFT_27123 [Syncephalis pseudoplumigaleata]|eukprot:RKP27210.1 hypothetical protein SYNPS1DRAFT_27123 [Syncephalis pseudoplumigaleata]